MVGREWGNDAITYTSSHSQSEISTSQSVSSRGLQIFTVSSAEKFWFLACWIEVSPLFCSSWWLLDPQTVVPTRTWILRSYLVVSVRISLQSTLEQVVMLIFTIYVSCSLGNSLISSLNSALLMVWSRSFPHCGSCDTLAFLDNFPWSIAVINIDQPHSHCIPANY